MPDGGPLVHCNLHFQPKQWAAASTVATELLYGGAAFGGKALALDTPIPTPDGWTTMRDVRVGGWVIGNDGRAVRVIAATEAMHGRPCMEVTTADGERVVCDEQHLWVTLTENERVAALRRTLSWRAMRRAKRQSRGTGKRPDLAIANATRTYPLEPAPIGVVRTTREIADDVGRPHSIACATAIDCADVALPIDPYVLGVWLGDGTASQAAFTSVDAEIVARVANAYPVTRRASPLSFGLPGGFLDKLRAQRLLGNKHVPEVYLRASRAQRLELVRGLMDTDGHATDSGAAEFTTTSSALRDGMHELLWSLGLKPSCFEGRAMLRGVDCGAKWRFKVWATEPLFHLPRKRVRQKLNIGAKTQRRFVRATPTDSVPVRCIQVENADGIFLCGRSMLPTHNSHLMRSAAILWCCEIPGLQVYIFRRVEDDLIKNHMDGPHGFRNMLAGMEAAGFVKILETEIRWWNGSKIHLCHCSEEKHRFKYHGAEIHVLLIDELTTFTEVIYRYLRFRVRMVGIKLPKKYQRGGLGPHGGVNEHKLFPRIVCGSNPGNIGHHWVKRTFIERERPTTPQRVADVEGGMVRQYIPARLEDNAIGNAEDPTYRARMRGLGDPMLVKAMEEGDWNIIAGGFFPEFTLERHVLKATLLPASHFSRRFRAHDHGSAKPFSTGWYGICDETWSAEGTLANQIVVPRGALVRYREWYGKKDGQDNVGLKLTVEQWAKTVLTKKDGKDALLHTVADPAMWISDGGPSLAERAESVKVNGRRLRLMKAINKRTAGSDRARPGGWDQVRARLIGDDPEGEGHPLLFLMDNQPDAIRLFQSVQHDETKPEDLDTDAEDHAIDEIRYACMSRPRPIRKEPPRVIAKGPNPWSLNGMAPIKADLARPSSYRIE